ncbi:MAG: hypothetical protein KKB70_05265 [Proteobacteria bacterium]|nr:hypothetical protein [Pseudomonadota bacterium]
MKDLASPEGRFVNEVVGKIAWEPLRAQKKALLKVIDALEESGDSRADVLSGLLHLVDALQDGAVDILGRDGREVFGPKFNREGR